MTTTPTRYIERIVVDTCSLLNWVNGGAFGAIVSLPVTLYVVGPLVELESTTIAKILAQQFASGKLVRLRNEDLNAAAFLELVDKYGLGEGEIECLAHALTSSDLIVCTDDKKARGIVTALLGRPRLIGTIGLLLKCFRNGTLNAEELRRSHELMIAAGAFLPSIRDEDLSAATTDANSDSGPTG